MIRAVVFDVGECLVDETRLWAGWADRLGVPRHTFSAVFGAALARGLDHRATFEVLVPGVDLVALQQARAAAGEAATLDEADLYPDARPTLARLRQLGLWVGIAGNQPARVGAMIRALDLPVDLVAASDDWGVEKPDPAFFDRLCHEAPCPPDQLLYVGDRLDNDIRPAAARGLRTALVRRGPWAFLQQDDPDATTLPTFRIDTLTELPDLVAPRDHRRA